MATDERRDERKENKDIGRRSVGEAKASEHLPARREDWSAFWNEPFASLWTGDNMFRRFSRDMDRWVHDTGIGRRSSFSRSSGRRLATWAPDIETLQRGDQFVVRADLPGMKKEDIQLQVTDDAVTIEGERRDEHEEQREGYY